MENAGMKSGFLPGNLLDGLRNGEFELCISNESQSLSRILAGKGGFREIRYWQQNWLACGSASERGLFHRLGYLW